MIVVVRTRPRSRVRTVAGQLPNGSVPGAIW